MTIKSVAVEEKKMTTRKATRYFCDKGGHWVTGFGTEVKPAVIAKKGGLTVRDCGQDHSTLKPEEKKEQPWCTAKNGKGNQCTRKAVKGSPYCLQHKTIFIKKSLETPFASSKKVESAKKQLKKVSHRISSSQNKLIISLVKKNPYRPGAQRTKAFDLLIKAGSKGVPYQTFVKAHGLVSDGAKKKFLKVEVVNG